MNPKVFAVWRVVDRYGFIIDFGIDDCPEEFDLEHLPNGWNGDTPIDNVQKRMSGNDDWKVEGYQFKYQIYSLDENLKMIKGDKNG